MSTRRARIKAVTALPPRRKNVDNADNRVKPEPVKEESVLKSPGTPSSKKLDVDEFLKNTSPIKQVAPAPQSKVLSPQIPVISQNQNTLVNPKTAEKVPVITSALSKSVFASPQPRTGSPIRNFASPIVSQLKVTPRHGIHPFKPNTPQRNKVNLRDNVEYQQSTVRSIGKKDNMIGIDNKSDITDDYSIPSVPESIADETVMDGIVPLQPLSSAPKPIDFLKNEIISETAEVLFDPIVPLPSPSKVRPKLRPVPRLAPLRRNSIQGSASESEDESRRALLNSCASTPALPRVRHDSHTSHNTLPSLVNRDVNRIRNDSVSSSISQITAHPPTAGSPMKEKQYSKTRRQDMSRRMAAMRRRRETVKRDKLTMYDLIFYNPTENPIIPDQDEIKAKEANKKEAERASEKTQSAEEDDPPAEETPVPQIKIGPNGEIILDEKSLVINQTDSKRKVSSVVREGSWGGGGGKYTRTARTAEWSAVETVRFYRALAAVGTDFTLMAPLFPTRNRRDLKIKFKKEEKINGAQVDKALRSATAWDAVRLQEEFEEERADAAKKAEDDKRRLQRQRGAEAQRAAAARSLNVRWSRGSKAMETSAQPMPRGRHQGAVTADEIIERAIEQKAEREKKRKLAAEAKKKKALTPQTPTAAYATLSLLPKSHSKTSPKKTPDTVTITRVNKSPAPQISINSMQSVPSNIETGSLVVLTVNDPNSPSKKMLQTYISHGSGLLTPVALPPNFLNSVVGYMKKGTTNSGSPNIASPLENKAGATPSVIQVNPSPVKKQRHNSYTVMQL